ncbi:MAG TPA: hypothetical protein VF720_13160 [Candidatus Eisenbacteria bacterium]
MKRVVLLSAALLGVTALPARALPVLDFQLGAHYVEPTGDIPRGDVEDAYGSGFGAYGRMRFPIGPARLAGAVTWNQLDGNGDVDDLDFLTFQVGPHYSFAVVSVGAELVWLTEFDELGYSPMVSVTVLKFEGTLAYTAAFESDSAEYVTFGIGWRF